MMYSVINGIFRKSIIALIISCLMLVSMYSADQQPTAEEIIKKMEGNQVYKTSQATGSMMIYDKYGETKKSFVMISEGSSAMLLEFTNPEDAGQKILRMDNEIFLYFPGTEKVIIIQGSALKDKVMGSDFSYEDMTGGRDLLSMYKVTLAGTEDTTIEDETGRTTTVNCYKIKLEAINRKKVVYPIEYIWVDKELMTYRKVHSCTADDKVLKEMAIIAVKPIAGRNAPVHMVMRDMMKKTSRTVLKIEDMQIGIKLTPDTFGLKELTW